MKDIIIIGAGIVGTTLARRLSQYKLDVLVLEGQCDVSMGATKANSAIVHGGYAESHDKLKGRLCYKGRVQYEKLNEQLGFGFDPIGSMVITTDENDLPKLKELLENGKKNGLKDLEILDHEQIVEMEPNINPEVKYALYCRGAGVTSPYEMAIAMMENAIENGVELKLNKEVVAIEKTDGVFVVKDQDNEQYKGRIVVNCAGINSGKVSQMVGIDDFRILPRSGEYILFNRGSGKVVKHVLFQMPTKMGKGILVTPTYHGNLLLGPDASDDEQFYTGTHVDRLAKIYQKAKDTTTYLEPSQFIRSFAGVRAVSSTDDFIVEETKVKGFIQCAGIQSPGLTSAPAIADMVVEIIQDNLLNLEEKTDFNPYRRPIIERKELMPFSQASKLVELESGDERLVCRCEQVSEKTIKDAMSRGIPVTTIDGVKRRTRAGMGFCQGAFCRPRVKALMEQILGHEIDHSFDTEQSGISRAGKSEFLSFLKEEEERQKKN